ncbi:MAG: iron chelate uptake ABC transporter family permease subunit [Rhodobacteraceae bacterium]|nr:iron chelate uptake ABC transporter family permease subunit [Paracoccaceae bacterium]
MFERRVLILWAILLCVCVAFLGWNLHGRIWFILELRAVKLSGLVLVGFAIGTSTVMFQTISGNRILTPSIMGFDALFLLLQTSMVFAIGGLGYAHLPSVARFIVETVIMMAAAMALFGWLLGRGRGRADVQLMILVGVIFGLLFRSLTSFLQRIIDPSEFAVVQGAMFASFGAIGRTELMIAALVFACAAYFIWRLMPDFDVMALGRGAAISLGLDYDRAQRIMLGVVAALVSVSTALVGPITFLGLLVASLSHIWAQTSRHAVLLPAAGLIAAIVLVAGQVAFERILHLQSTLAVVIEFFGGMLFLVLVAKGKVR